MQLNYSAEEKDTSSTPLPDEGLEAEAWPLVTRFQCPHCLGKPAHSDAWSGATAKKYPGDVRPLLDEGRRSKNHFYVCPWCGKESLGAETIAPERPKEDRLKVPTQKPKVAYTLKNEKQMWEDFRKVIPRTLGITVTDATLKKYRDTWRANKGWLFEYLDDDGRLETINDEPLSPEERSHVIDTALKETPSCALGVPSVGIQSVIRSHFRRIILEAFNYEQLADNRVKNMDRIQQEVYRKECAIGMKLSKYFLRTIRAAWNARNTTPENRLTYIMHHMKKDGWNQATFDQAYEWAGVWFSRVTDALKTSGRKIVLSVNPLDFITASCHTTGWSSCISVTGGSYKHSCFSHMLDSTSMIGFSYTRKDEFYSARVPRKSWRQFVYLDKEHASALVGRQYPQSNQSYEKVTRAMVAHILIDEMQTERKWKYKNVQSGGEYRWRTHGGIYTDSPSSRIILSGGSIPDMSVGVDIPCLRCGQNAGARLVCEGSTCKSPGARIQCVECGDYIGEPYDTLNGEPYCEGCWDDHIRHCVDCDEAVHMDNARTVHGHWVCDHCYEQNYFECHRCNQDCHTDDHWWINGTGEDVCFGCKDSHYFLCPDCDEYEDIKYAQEVNGKTICRQCHEEEREDTA